MRRTLEDLERIQREFLRPGEVMEFLGVSKSTFYKHKDKFPFRIEKIGKKMFIPRRAFIEFVKRQG